MERLVALVLAENGRQSLISPASEPLIWSRHIEDSLQLLLYTRSDGVWIDVGSGAGFPGLVVAIASRHDVVLVEPRALRADFLRRAADATGCSNVSVFQGRAETLQASNVAVLSARAVAPLSRLFEMAGHLTAPTTLWLLPKGKSAQAELAEARETWQGEFRVERSLTSPDAGIVIAQHVRRRASR